MPLPQAIAAAVLPAVGQAIGAKAGYKKQRRLMELQQTFNVENYERQKQDNLDFWAMQNQYNSPEAQMERLKQAGLNPNMIYGSGGGITEASPIRGADMQGVSVPNVPYTDFGIGDSIANYQQAEIRQVNTDNLRQDLINKRTINDLNVIKTIGELIKNDTGEFTLDQKRRAADTNFEILGLTAEKLKEDIYKTQVDSYTEYQANERQNKLQPGKIKLQGIQAAYMVAQTKKSQAEYNRVMEMTNYIKNSDILQKAEIEARKNGWSWKDDALKRFILQSVPTGRLSKIFNENIDSFLDFFN